MSKTDERWGDYLWNSLATKTLENVSMQMKYFFLFFLLLFVSFLSSSSLFHSPGQQRYFIIRSRNRTKTV